jgi:hypothetical protein
LSGNFRTQYAVPLFVFDEGRSNVFLNLGWRLKSYCKSDC